MPMLHNPGKSEAAVGVMNPGANLVTAPARIHNPAPTVAPPDFFGASVTQLGAQSIGAGVTAALAFDSEEFDIGGYHDNAINNSRLTVPAGKAGKHLVIALGGIDLLSGDQDTRVEIHKNGTLLCAASHVNGSTDANCVLPAYDLLELAVGDFVEMFIFNGDTIARNAGQEGLFPRLQIVKVDNAAGTTFTGVKATASGTQSVPNLVVTNILFDTEEFDTDGFHPGGSSANFTVPAGEGGKYLAIGLVAVDALGAEKFTDTWIRVNGAILWRSLVDKGSLASADEGFGAGAILDLSVGDIVTIAFQHDNGSARSTISRAGQPLFGLFKINGAGTAGADHGAAATHTANIAMGAPSTLDQPFNSEVGLWDTDAIHDTVTNNTRMTVPAGLGGKWLSMVSFYMSTITADTQAGVFILKNGTAIAKSRIQYGSNTIDKILGYLQIVDLAATDFLEQRDFNGGPGANSSIGSVGIYTPLFQVQQIEEIS